MSPPSRTICHISKIPSEIRQLITSNLSGKSTLQADSIELDSALDFGYPTKVSNSSTAPP